MRAIGVSRFGGVEALELYDAPVPEPREGEALVRVHFAGVNFVDVHMRRGEFEGSGEPRGPRLVGREGAGEVVKVGPGVSGVKTGDRVAWCISEGSYAEMCAVPAWRLVPVPADIPLDLACAIQLQGATAHYLGTATFPLNTGDVALVHSGAGGVGQLLTQVAKARGANVIATVGSEARAAIALGRGADLVIVRSKESFLERVMAVTGRQGCHAVYDAVGNETFADSLAACRRRGVVALYGGASGVVDTVAPTLLAAAGSIFLTRPHITDYMQDAAEVKGRGNDMFGLLRDGRLKVDIERVLPLEGAREAHGMLESRGTFGKLLLKPTA